MRTVVRRTNGAYHPSRTSPRPERPAARTTVTAVPDSTLPTAGADGRPGHAGLRRKAQPGHEQDGQGHVDHWGRDAHEHRRPSVLRCLESARPQHREHPERRAEEDDPEVADAELGDLGRRADESEDHPCQQPPDDPDRSSEEQADGDRLRSRDVSIVPPTGADDATDERMSTVRMLTRTRPVTIAGHPRSEILFQVSGCRARRGFSRGLSGRPSPAGR